MPTENNTEIERKFLVKKLPKNLESFKHYEMSQSYICVDPTLRIRKKDDQYIFTFKSGKGVEKVEFEHNLTQEQYNRLLEKTETKEIVKTRYIIPLDGGLNGELDIYHGFLDGFVNVEVEFKTRKAADEFIPPDWFGEDVSEKKQYSNSLLSINGIPSDYNSAVFGK